ncbi:hypothetical protein [Streptomyces sp. NPDC051219]|uniref:hypothetical protein n=1 Tax=Streptomyces sp. NPDC051219 TaxID=3155283 RepID=UPI00343DD4D6
MDATEIKVRRLSAHRGGRSRFVSGKSRINALKALVLTDERGRLLFCGEARAGSVADITHARDAGLIDLRWSTATTRYRELEHRANTRPIHSHGRPSRAAGTPFACSSSSIHRS